jgi:hypothetical protein
MQTNVKIAEIDPHIPGLPGIYTNRSDKLLSILFYLSQGYSTRQDISRLMNYSTSLHTSLKEQINCLDKRLGYINQLTIRFYGHHGAVKIISLNEKGKQFCSQYWDLQESDFEKLQRLHQGDSQLKHTAAVLNFAYHARLRGYTATVVPDRVDLRESIYYPDVLITKAKERWYVEVETLPRQHKISPVKDMDRSRWAKKWNNQHAVQNFVVFCALNENKRLQLARELSHYWRGMGTDLETLFALKKDGDFEHLFVQEWKWKQNETQPS